MAEITHHIPEDVLLAYASGRLETCFALVVAAHVSLCDDCRVGLAAQEAAGGAVLEDLKGVAVAPEAKDRVLRLLDTPAPTETAIARSGIFPGPVMQALNGQPPKWRRVGGGVRQSILFAKHSGSVRLLYIPPGEAVPDHGHGGLELTLVLQGSFRDETGAFGVGDVEVADLDLQHTPVAGTGAPCVCLAATDAPLRFRALLPRLFQPVFRI